MKIVQVEHHEKEYDDCDGDYIDIELILGGEVIATFGDYYHDKGDSQATGFIKGMEYALKQPIEVEYKYVADREW